MADEQPICLCGRVHIVERGPVGTYPLRESYSGDAEKGREAGEQEHPTRPVEKGIESVPERNAEGRLRDNAAHQRQNERATIAAPAIPVVVL